MEINAKILTPEDEILSRNIDDYPEGIIIPIDKPYRWTSADVIRKVKFAAIRHFGTYSLIYEVYSGVPSALSSG